MTVYFWVGGTGTADNTNTIHWSLTSGGAAGAGPVTGADDMTFDVNSGGGTVTFDTGISVHTIDSTTFVGAIVGPFNVFVSGDLIIGSSVTGTGGLAIAAVGSGTVNVTSNGKTLGLFLTNSGNTPNVVLQDSMVLSPAALTLAGTGSFNANGFNVTAPNFGISAGAVTMGSGTWTATTTSGGNVWGVGTDLSIVINAGTSTILFAGAGSNTQTFQGRGHTYYNFTSARGAGTGNVTITGANTFNDINDIGSVARTFTFPASTITTVSNFSMAGASGALILLRSSSSGTQFTLAKAGGGTVNSNYLNIQDSNATSGTWNAGSDSVDNGNNTGWVFGAPIDFVIPPVLILPRGKPPTPRPQWFFVDNLPNPPPPPPGPYGTGIAAQTNTVYIVRIPQINGY